MKTLLQQYIDKANAEIAESIKNQNCENPDPTVDMKWPLSEITIPDYQRAVDIAKVNRIIGLFDWNLVQQKLINIRDGKAYLINGLQTYTALCELAKKGLIEPYIKVKVSSGLTYAEEAELFIKQYENCSRVKQVDMFKASEKAGIDWAVKIRELFETLGLTTIRGKKAMRYNINAIGKILQIYYIKNNGGIDAVEMALRLIIESGFAEFDGGFTTMMLEIGNEAARLGVKYRDKNYLTILKAMRAATKGPDEFVGITKEAYPSNTGQHGEGSIKLYVRHLVGLIK